MEQVPGKKFTGAGKPVLVIKSRSKNVKNWKRFLAKIKDNVDKTAIPHHPQK